MIQDYDGAAVIDARGERIGIVERSYVDDCGSVQFVETKIGKLRAKHRLVPATDARRTGAGLEIPYTKETVIGSPDASSVPEALKGEKLEEVRAYYAPIPTNQEVGEHTEQAASVPVATSEK